MSRYRNSTLLYRPSLSIWTARKKDKNETVKVNTNAGATVGAANVNKQLLPDSPELLAIQKWATGFRTWVYQTTLPWDDSGWRIGRVERHMDFMSEVGDRITAGDLLVDAFVANYATSVEEARFKLSVMFDPMDYPTPGSVRSKFSFSVDCMPLSNDEDFRVVDGLPQEEVDRMVTIASDATEARIASAMEEAYKRLYAVVAKMASTLQQYGNKEIKKFNDTLVGNIADLVDIMPALNLTNDPRLNELTDAARNLAAYDLSDLRKLDGTREAAIKEASALAKKFKAFTLGIEEEPAPRAEAAPVDAMAALASGWE